MLRTVTGRTRATRTHRTALGRATSVLLLASVGLVGLSTTASAESQVTVTDEAGTPGSTVTAGSVVTVSGTGFQSVQGGAGGIYVVFGWVDDAEGGSWRPSNGGATGADYLYAPDSEDAQNAGFQRFVAFPGAGTAVAANGGTIADDGTWSTPLTIPAAQFDALDRTGAAAPVDCTQVQCGIITFGAHGIKNATNESFTPVTFADPAADAAAAEVAAAEAAEAEAAASAEASAAAEETSTETAEPVASSTTDSSSTDAPTPTTSTETDDDAFLSPSARLVLSIAGGAAALAVLVVLTVRKARAREAAAGTSSESDDEPGTPSPGGPGTEV